MGNGKKNVEGYKVSKQDILDDIAPQLSKKQIEDLKSVICMAKETGKPQLVFNGLGLKLIVFPSGLLTKKYDDMEGY